MIQIVKDRSNENGKGSYYLRTFAGAYLLYLVYGLLEDYKNGVSNNDPLILCAIFIFFTVGILLMYSSLRHLYIHRQSSDSKGNENK